MKSDMSIIFLQHLQQLDSKLLLILIWIHYLNFFFFF